MLFSSLTVKTLMASLAEAWTVEEWMARTLDSQFQESENPEACRLYYEHAEVSYAQKERLERHLEAMDVPRVAGAGGFTAGVKAHGAVGLWNADRLEVEAQHLRTAYARAQLECAMYRALQAQASSLKDHVTWRLAQDHLLQEEAHARSLWPYIGMASEAAYGCSRG